MNNFWEDPNFMAGVFTWTLVIVLIGLVFYWVYRVFRLMKFFVAMSMEILRGTLLVPKIPAFFHVKDEVKGVYQGREVVAGIVFSGLNEEFLPLPYIRVTLKETIGYNLNRLPHDAEIQKNFLVYKPRVSFLWGVFDRDYLQLFSHRHFLMLLEKFWVAAEDLERGRTIKEIFKK